MVACGHCLARKAWNGRAVDAVVFGAALAHSGRMAAACCVARRRIVAGRFGLAHCGGQAQWTNSRPPHRRKLVAIADVAGLAQGRIARRFPPRQTTPVFTAPEILALADESLVVKDMQYKSLVSVVVVLGLNYLPTPVQADTWLLPEKKSYYSSDKKYRVETIPKKLESQLKYFQDKVKGRENAGAARGGKEARAQGIFSIRRTMGGYAKKTEFSLVNEVAPVDVLISNKGEYIVTFDNWHSVGYGDNVVVIYRTDGKIIKKFGLEDLLTDGDIEMFPVSASSRWWGANHYIDEARKLLVLRVISNRKSLWEKDAKFFEIKIDLATGRPLEPKRDLFNQPTVISSVVDSRLVDEPQVDSSRETREETSCSSNKASFESVKAVRISSEQLYAKAKNRPLPPYPPIAKAARAEGTVIVELLVSKSGDVICARTLSGHPLLKRAAVAAVINWKFEPVPISNEVTIVASTVAITFKLGD